MVDLMQPDRRNSLIYERDYSEWLEITLAQLENNDLENIDWEHLIEEIAALGNEQKHKVESYLRQLIKHLLIYKYWELEKAYCAKGWVEEIDDFKSQLSPETFPVICPYDITEILDPEWLP
jgi:Domain of unknown function DUF29